MKHTVHSGHETGLKALIRKLRRSLRSWLSVALSRCLGTPTPLDAPSLDPERILVCRLNARLGNILFLTPLLQSIAATFPQSEIDILVREQAHVDLLAGLPGLRKVHVLPRRLPDLLRFIRKVRRRQYDLAIDPCIQSSSNRIAVALCGARYRLGFAGSDQWLRLTHAAARPETESHEALKPLRLLDEAVIGRKPKWIKSLAVCPSTHSRMQAGQLIEKILGRTLAGQRRTTVGFFAGATGFKRLEPAWWRDWFAALKNLLPEITLIQLLPPDSGQQSIDSSIAAVSAPELSVVASVMYQVDIFIAADGGPMHLAVAAGVPVVGLFTATDPDRYGPLGHDCVSLTAPLNAVEVAHEVKRWLTTCSRRNVAYLPPIATSHGTGSR